MPKKKKKKSKVRKKKSKVRKKTSKKVKRRSKVRKRSSKKPKKKKLKQKRKMEIHLLKLLLKQNQNGLKVAQQIKVNINKNILNL